MRTVRVGVVDQGREEKLRLYRDALVAAGATVTVLRWQDASRDAAEDARAFDAVVLCGGDDVDASRFGESNHPSVELVPPTRDEYEIAFVRAAVDGDVPLLGVCRGAQIMNVALGGSLEQHVPDIDGRAEHRDGTSHEIAVLPRTLLARLMRRRRRAVVNSYHHQAVGRLAPSLRVAARSVDGGVEAVEGPGGFCLGVQWHPERQGNDAPLGADLFGALVAAAAEKQGRNGRARSSKGPVGRVARRQGSGPRRRKLG